MARHDRDAGEPGRDTGRRVSSAGWIALAWGAGCVLTPPLGLVGRIARAAHAADGGVALLTDVLGAGLWLLVGWLTLAIGALHASRLPGAVGRRAQAFSNRITPTLLRRVIGGGAALGLGLAPLLAASVASAAPTRTGAVAACSPDAGRNELPSLDRPTTVCVTPPPTMWVAAGAPTPNPPTPTTNSVPARSSPVDRRPTVGTDTRHVVPLLTPAGLTATDTVRPGDTLWGLATAELRSKGLTPTPVRVSERWPAWWAANREVVGASAALLHPGEVLTMPPMPPKPPMPPMP